MANSFQAELSQLFHTSIADAHLHGPRTPNRKKDSVSLWQGVGYLELLASATPVVELLTGPATPCRRLTVAVALGLTNLLTASRLIESSQALGDASLLAALHGRKRVYAWRYALPVRAVGVSLWLIPEPAARERLAATIAELARRLGAPSFEPHVTLIGGLGQEAPEIVAPAGKLAAATRPFQVQLARLGHGARYFRCVFYEISDSAGLAELHSRARSLLRPEEDRPFFPHLSLLYADLDEPTRRRLVEDLSGTSLEAFDVDELQVVRTEGGVEEWRPLAAFPLSRRD